MADFVPPTAYFYNTVTAARDCRYIFRCAKDLYEVPPRWALTQLITSS